MPQKIRFLAVFPCFVPPRWASAFSTAQPCCRSSQVLADFFPASSCSKSLTTSFTLRIPGREVVETLLHATGQPVVVQVFEQGWDGDETHFGQRE